jgi:hypothetical protein
LLDRPTTHNSEVEEESPLARAGRADGATLSAMERALRVVLLLALVGAVAPAFAQAPARVVVFEEFGNPG